jgi:hypothetical protein
MEIMISNMFPSTPATLFEPLAALQIEDCEAKENNRTQYKYRVAHISSLTIHQLMHSL